MNRSRNFTAIVVAIMAFLAAILSCNFDQTEKKTTVFDQYYIINPETLLTSLKKGETNVFSPADERPEDIPSNQQIPVNWSQADYLYIVNALYKHVLGETLQDWQLNKTDFALGCKDVGIGFQNGRFEFFKLANKHGRGSRITLFVDIDPRHNFVNLWEAEYYPKLVDWTAVDLAQLKISADDVLEFAENSGGQQKRQSVGNACDISMWLSPDSARYKGWEVLYTRIDDRTSLFHIQIDPVTEQIHFP